MHERNRVGDLLRGLGALAALVGLVVGVPVALVRLAGSPLPSTLPRWSEVGHALGQSRVADSTLIKGAALICWVAWGVLVVCVLAEVAAWVMGRTVARLPVLGPVQVWAARLVASAVLVFSSVAGAVRPAVAVPTVARPAPVVQLKAALAPAPAPAPAPMTPDPVGGTSATEDAVAARPALPAPAGAKRYIVDPPGGRQRDTLWGIAERHLGNPERWPEIFQLNKDRVTAGHRVSNPHWIYAGEELILPADAIGLDPMIVASPQEPPPQPPPVQSVQAPASASGSTSSTSGSTSGSSSVEMRVVPDDEAQPQAAAKTPEGWQIAHTVADLLPRRITPADFAGGGLLAAGVVAAFESRRRTRQRRRRPGAAFLLPDEDLAATELGLRVAANVDGAELVHTALRLVGLAGPTPEVLGLRVGPRQVAIRFADVPPRPQPPFRSAGDGWVLPRRAITEVLVGDAAGAAVEDLPFVTLGDTDDGETVVLNLRAVRAAAVAGSRETAMEFLAAAATELANGEWIACGRLVLIGLGRDLANLAHVVCVPAVAGVGELRRGDVVVCGEPPGPLAERLPAGVSLLAIGPVRGSKCRLVIGDGRLEADVLDAVVRPPRLAQPQIADIAKLLEVIDDPVDDEPSVAVVEPLPVVAEVEPVPQAELEVRVLGPIEIVGTEKPLVRAKSIELIVYLSVFKDAVVDADRLREALWPGRPPGTTLYTTASVARNHLGRASSGEQHLPLLPNGERVYRIGKSVGTDYERFAEGVRRAKSEPPEQAILTLRAALELVRGRPFESASRGYEWAHVGLSTCMENEIAGAAHRLAGLCIEAGDADSARWAARQGLRACPGNEQLYRDLMLASDVEGNRAGIEALMNELSHVVEEDSPLEALHPETVALYNQLTSAERSAHQARTG